MGPKILILAAFCIAAVSSSTECDLKHLRIRYGYSDAYHRIPLTKAGLLEEGYSLMAHDTDLNVDFYSYKEDPRVTIGVDTYGNIAGVRVSFMKKDMPLLAQKNNVTFVYDLSIKPMFKSAVYHGEEVFYNTALFASPEKLLAGGRAETGGYVFEEIWVRVNGVWDLLPRHECNATAANYVREACTHGMGRHYFYTSKECQDVQGVFGLYTHHELMGMGLTSFGSFRHGPHRKWLEVVTPDEAREILIVRPYCLIDWTEMYSITSLHMYFCDDPMQIDCPAEDEEPVPNC